MVFLFVVIGGVACIVFTVVYGLARRASGGSRLGTLAAAIVGLIVGWAAGLLALSSMLGPTN